MKKKRKYLELLIRCADNIIIEEHPTNLHTYHTIQYNFNKLLAVGACYAKHLVYSFY